MAFRVVVKGKVNNCHIAVGQEIKDEYGAAQEFDLTPSQCDALKPGKFIGQGAFATAYEVEGDPTRVVKFTADPLDAKAAQRIQRTKPKGTLRIDKVATLLGKKTYGPDAIRIYDASKDDFTERVGPQPIYAIVGERLARLEPRQRDMVEVLKRPYHTARSWLAKQDPATFKVPTNIRDEAMSLCGRKLWYDPPECSLVIDEAIAAVEEVAHKTGAIPLDIHPGNWGMHVPSGDLALLDLGVSAGVEKDRQPASLAGAEDALNVTVAVGIGIARWLALRKP
jgi:hypothetical protein